MKQFKTKGFIAPLVALSIAFVGCTKRNDHLLTNTFFGALGDDVKTLDPANAYDSISLSIVPLIYEPLYQYHYLSETYKVVPLAAADMPTYSADRLTVTIPIRRDIRFQADPAFKTSDGKGRIATAHDFIYQFKRLALPSLQAQGWWIFDGKIAGINAFKEKLSNAKKEDVTKLFEEPIEGIKALDDYTLQLKLIKPYPQLLYILSMPFTSALPKEAVSAYGDEKGNLTEKAIGTGPYKLTKWERGHKLVLDRNPDYHPDFYPTDASPVFKEKGLLADAGKTLPFIDHLDYQIIKEPQPMWLNFMKGELDLMGVPKDNFSTAIQNNVNLSPELIKKGIKLHISPGARFYYISFNSKDKLFANNKALRQAISSSINRESWIEIFTNGRGKKLVNALPAGLPDRPKNSVIKYDFDVNKGKELIKKAGYPDGIDPATKQPLVINLDMRGADSVSRQMGDFFSQQMGALGIKLNVIYNSFPAFLEKLKGGNLQMSLGGWSLDYPDAENVYQLLYSLNGAPGPNDSNYKNSELDSLYEKIAVTESGPEREKMVVQIDSILQEDCPWALGYYATDYELTQGWLLNHRGDPIIWNTQKYRKIDLEAKKRYLKP